MIDCKYVEEKIVLGEPLDADAELHLLGCRSCQAFAQVHNLAVGLPELSKETDAAVLAACHASFKRPVMHIFRKITAFAACLVVVLALTLFHFKRHEKSSDFALSTEEQWMLSYSLDDDDVSDMELLLSGMELSLIASSNNTVNTATLSTTTDLHYEILSLEMDLTFQ